MLHQKLLVDEFLPIRSTRYGASVVFAENTIAVSGDEIVDPVAEELGKQTADFADAPNTAEVPGGAQSSVGFGKCMFDGEAVIGDDGNGIKVGSVDSMLTEECVGEFALKWSIAKAIVAIMAEEELDETIAESADAVVEHDCFAGLNFSSWAHGNSVAPCLRFAGGGEDLFSAGAAEGVFLKVDQLDGMGGCHGATVVVAMGEIEGVSKFVDRLFQ